MIFGILGAMVGSVTYAILAGLLRAFNRRYNARHPTVLHPEMYHRFRIRDGWE
jgi:predicted PurR-regulated permease PerM